MTFVPISRRLFTKKSCFISCLISSLFSLSIWFLGLIFLLKNEDFVSEEEKLQILQQAASSYYSKQEKYATSQIHHSCQSYLESFNIPITAILIDENILPMIMNGSCAELQGYPAKIKIGSQNFSNETLDSQFNAKFDVFQFTSSNETDYLDFSTNPRRIIPKYFQLLRVGNFLIPGNITRFLEYWKRSKLINCVNITMDRVVEKPKLNPQFAIKALSLLRDIIVDHGMYPFLMEGTLLGWYRECNIIPHTHDMDLAIFASEYNPELLESLQSSDVFDVTRVLGEMEDSFELTVNIKKVGGALTDIFLMYREDLGDRFTYDFIGGSDDANDRKLKFIFPKYDPWCAADLLGHIFWVTCSPDFMIPFEFGKEEWKHDYPSEKYSWCESQKNTMLNGKLRKTEEKA